MIISRVTDLGQYKGINKNLDTAIEFLLSSDLITLKLGKTEINENVYVMRFNYIADNVANDFFEGHKQYLDMHIVIKGKERMCCTDVQHATLKKAFDYDNDIGIFEGENVCDVVLQQYLCLITFPHDLHEPKVKENNEMVDKIVVKVKL